MQGVDLFTATSRGEPLRAEQLFSTYWLLIDRYMFYFIAYKNYGKQLWT